METLTVVREVNFTKYALLPFIQYSVQEILDSKSVQPNDDVNDEN